MNHVKLFDSFLTEKKKVEHKFEYGCLMADVNHTDIHLSKLHKLIETEDVFESKIAGEYGLEKDPHITVLFGFHDDGEAKLADDILSEDILKEVTFTIKGASIFESKDGYDVLKLDIKSKDLMDLNKKYTKEFEYTSNFAYNPHLTIAYIKTGKGEAYAKQITKELKDLEVIGEEFSVTKFIYSRPNGKRPTLSVKKKKED